MSVRFHHARPVPTCSGPAACTAGIASWCLVMAGLLWGPWPVLAQEGIPLERAPLPELSMERVLQVQPAQVWAVPSVRLLKGDMLGENLLPADTRLLYTPTGWVRDCLLPAPMELQGLPLRGGGHDWMTGFHPDGSLRTAWLSRSTEIDGIPCARATVWAELFGKGGMTTLHPDGSLESCRLAKRCTIDGQTFRKGQRIRLDPEGHLVP
ncbi:MAG: hypothetical protein KC518_06500 [Candidatus Cloacimonetes bacterium]|nr:hypothetical protein [Candidatus Cloacimonadota bacterium]